MNNRYENLIRRVRNGEHILIDGATGTEIERRGVPQLDNAWNGGGAMSHPDIVRGVHEDYIRNGAEIIISNTFATSKHALHDAGVEDQFERLNRRGVELAIEACARMQRPGVLVAGGVSYWSWTGRHPPLDVLRDGVKKQIEIMAKAGADLLMLEMMTDIKRMLTTLEAAQSGGLPVWVGLTCEPDETNTMCLRSGETLIEALAAIKDRNVPLVSIMHTEVKHIDACLDVMKEHWSGPIGVYAHTGLYVNPKWIFDDTISPEDYAAASGRWLARGVQVIGGCCGIRADHIAAVRDII